MGNVGSLREVAFESDTTLGLTGSDENSALDAIVTTQGRRYGNAHQAAAYSRFEATIKALLDRGAELMERPVLLDQLSCFILPSDP